MSRRATTEYLIDCNRTGIKDVQKYCMYILYVHNAAHQSWSQLALRSHATCSLCFFFEISMFDFIQHAKLHVF